MAKNPIPSSPPFWAEGQTIYSNDGTSDLRRRRLGIVVRLLGQLGMPWSDATSSVAQCFDDYLGAPITTLNANGGRPVDEALASMALVLYLSHCFLDNGEAVQSFVERYELDGWEYSSLACILGLRLLGRAGLCLESGEFQDAFYLILEAEHALQRSIEFGLDLDKIASDVRSTNAQAAALARHSNTTYRIRAKAIDLSRKRSYKSLRHAARAITPQVLTFAAEIGVQLRTNDPERTIYNWIRKAHAQDK